MARPVPGQIEIRFGAVDTASPALLRTAATLAEITYRLDEITVRLPPSDTRDPWGLAPDGVDPDSPPDSERPW